MRIAGITRVRNEEKIIRETLDHFSRWVDAIYVFDDASTDHTADICKNHSFVRSMIKNKKWAKDRLRAEFETRQAVLKLARNDNPDYILYFDADERIDWNFLGYEDYEGVKMRLFDFYITEEDEHKPYYKRQWLGPEFREITILFKNRPEYNYTNPDQREILVKKPILRAGYVKHCGKAISVEEWERTCVYYTKYFPEPYKSKWEKRKGKAIHSLSDFNRPLIKWADKDKFGIPI